MKSDGIAQASILILQNILDGYNANKAINLWFKKNRYAGSTDKSLIRDIVFSALRRKKSSFLIFEKFGLPKNSRSMVANTLFELGYDLSQYFTSSKYGPIELNFLERKALIFKNETLKYAKDSDIFDYPEFLENELKKSLGVFYESFLESSKIRAPLFIRINNIKSTLEDVKFSLDLCNIKTKKIPGTNNSLIILSNHRKIKNTVSYNNGFFEIQDISSQIAIELINVKKKLKILDFCAGSGGKTLALASKLKGAGNFYAYDDNIHRMKDIKKRLFRNGVKCKILNKKDISSGNLFFDLVIVDVPCSGSGTWRRNPELKWNLDKEKLNKILKNQANILLTAGSLLISTGKIAYITCSVLDCENTNQIEYFLSQNKNFVLEKEIKIFGENCGDWFYLSILKKV